MTFAGHHTIDELQWLVKSRDYFYARLQRAWYDFGSTWLRSDKAAASHWLDQFTDFGVRYGKAREAALGVIADVQGNPYVPNDAANVDVQWNAIIAAFQQVPYTTTDGDFSDLSRRLRAAGGNPTYPDIPPDDSVDTDLAIYKSADDAVKAVEKAGQTTVDYGAPIAAVLVGAGLLYLLKK